MDQSLTVNEPSEKPRRSQQAKERAQQRGRGTPLSLFSRTSSHGQRLKPPGRIAHPWDVQGNDSAPVAQVACAGLAPRGERNRYDELVNPLAADPKEAVESRGNSRQDHVVDRRLMRVGCAADLTQVDPDRGELPPRPRGSVQGRTREAAAEHWAQL